MKNRLKKNDTAAFKYIGILLLLIILSCSSSDKLSPTVGGATPTPDPTDFSVLFIGNSLTYTNDLPQLLRTKARDEGITLSTQSISMGGYGLQDHWEDGDIQQEIESREFDFVIIQQGPSSQAEGRASLIEYGGRIAQLCRAHNAMLVYYMVWPSQSNYHTFDGVIANYTEAASLSSSKLAPVGSVWKAFFDTTSDFSYYGPDGFHPSLEGSTVAAEVIFESLDL